jgi:DNA replication protein DnaC
MKTFVATRITNEVSMLLQPLLDQLMQLRLPAMREGLKEQLSNPRYAELAFEERLALLVDLECTRRRDHRLQRQMKQAGFPLPATLEDLDFSPTRGLDRRTILELAQGHWVEHHLNLLVIGPTGAGKSFLSCALGLAACRIDHSVRYFRTARLLAELAQSHLNGSYSTFLQSLMKCNLLILDDWMRDPISPAEARDLLEVVDDRFGRASLLVASQLPVQEWFSQFPNPTHADAILDRIIHNAYRLTISGDSQRKLRAAFTMPST